MEVSTYIIMYSIIVFTIVHKSLYIDKPLGLITCNQKIFDKYIHLKITYLISTQYTQYIIL